MAAITVIQTLLTVFLWLIVSEPQGDGSTIRRESTRDDSMETTINVLSEQKIYNVVICQTRSLITSRRLLFR
jgi:hypothetical protein